MYTWNGGQLVSNSEEEHQLYRVKSQIEFKLRME